MTDTEQEWGEKKGKRERKAKGSSDEVSWVCVKENTGDGKIGSKYLYSHII